MIFFPFVAWNCTTNALSICILHSKILTSTMISGCIVWFRLDASLLSSWYDHRWYRATQQAIYVASVEEMAYIGSTWVATAMWPVMMQTILILNVQEKTVKETCRFIRWVMTTSEQNGNVILCMPAHYEGKQSSKSRSKSKSTPDDWCHLISQNHIMPALFDHDFKGNREQGCTWCLSIWSPSYQGGDKKFLKYVKANLKLHLRSRNAKSTFWP